MGRHYSIVTINCIFNKCSLHSCASEQPGTVTVSGFMGHTFLFDMKKLQSQGYHIILSLLKHLPPKMRRSVSDTGAPWISVASDANGIYWMSLETADKLACMAIALGLLVRQSSTSPEVTDMDFVIIEDLRQRKIEAISPSCKRNSRRKLWNSLSNVKNEM